MQNRYYALRRCAKAGVYDYETCIKRMEGERYNEMRPFRHKMDAESWIRSDMAKYNDTHYTYLLEFDGGARGNPGISGSGACLRDVQTGRSIARGYWYLHHYGTNNLAEMYAVKCGLEMIDKVIKNKQEVSLLIQGDSTLIVKMLRHINDVNDNQLYEMKNTIYGYVTNYAKYDFKWVPRELNAEADRLSNMAMDTRAKRESIRLTGLCMLKYTLKQCVHECDA